MLILRRRVMKRILRRDPDYDFWFDTNYSTDPLVKTALTNLPRMVDSIQLAEGWINELPKGFEPRN